MLYFKEGGYTDFEPVIDFYTLFRGIFNAFWEMVKGIAQVFGIDIEEGKTETE